MPGNARIFRLVLVSLLAAPLLAQSPPGSVALEGKTVQQIVVQGLSKVHESTVLHEMMSQVGAPYSAANVAKDRERLDRMALFSKIAIQAEAGTNGVILRVELKETMPYLPYPSIGITGEQGVTAGVGLKSTNFLGTGANLATAVRFGGEKEFEVIASSPWRPRNSWWWKTEYFLIDRQNAADNDRERSNEVTFQAGRQVTERLRVGGRFHYIGLKADVSGITLSPTNKDMIPGFGLVAEYDSRDSWTNPKRGWWNSVDGTKNGLWADGNYWTFNFDMRRYQPISGRHGLAVFSLLTLQTGTVGVDIPVHEIFQIGGTNTIRGFAVNSRQGKDQWLSTLEYRYDLVKPRDISVKGVNFYAGVQLAAFTDAGSAWDTGDQFTKNFIGGGGVGIRLIVPYVNLIRFDLGFGQSGRGAFVNIGSPDKPVSERRRVR